MRRVLQLLGLVMTGFLSIQTFAQEPTDAEVQESADEPKAEPPAPSAPAVPAVAPAPAAVVPAAVVTSPPALKPKVGDTTTSGYFRGGWGGNLHQKGRMTCFALSTISGELKSRYRLGNECEIWGEYHLATVAYAGDDGTVGTLHFMPTVYIPTTYVGYSPISATSVPDQGNYSTGATVAFPNLYADMKGIGWLFGGTAWVGTRYYKRESVYISDFFYWNPSGLGGGIEDVTLGKIWDSAPDVVSGMTFSWAAFAVDGQPRSNPFMPQQMDLGIRNDLQIRGFRPWTGADLQLGFQHILDWSNDKDANGNSVTHGGWGVTFRYVQELLGGDNKFVVQYGKGGGTGFGTLSRFYYPDFSLRWGPAEWRLRLLDVITIQPLPWLGAQVVGSYQRDDKGTGESGAVDEWYSAGGRVSFGVLEHLKVLGEVGYDKEAKSNGAPALWLIKATGAIAISGGRGFWARPELRLFFTQAQWSEAATIGGIDSGRIYTETYTDNLNGYIFGLQGEVMW
jgi:maltoporin